MVAAIPVRESGFDLAASFSTLLTTQGAIVQALQNIQTTIGQQQSQVRQMNPVINQGTGGSPVGSTHTGNIGGAGGSGGGNPLAGVTGAQTATGGGGGGGYTSGTSGPGWLSTLPGWSYVDQGLSEVRSQREKNARYQSIEGGPASSGFGERWNEGVYQFSTMGVFSGAEASQAFYGATQLGYNNQSGHRQNALNYMYNGKTQRGQSVTESLQQLDVASKAGITSFGQLTDALNQLSDAAGNAGVNAKQARAMMMSSTSQGLARGLGASASIAYAQNTTTMQTSYGNWGAQLDLSGQNTYGFDIMTAGGSGVSFQKYEGSLLGKDGGAFAAAARDTSIMGKIKGILPGSVITYIQQQIAAFPNGKDDLVGRGNGSNALSVAQAALQYWNSLGNYNPQTFDAYCRAYMANDGGGNGQTGQMAYIVEQIAGNNASSTLANKKAADPSKLGLGSVTANANDHTSRKDLSQTTKTVQSDAASAYAGLRKGGMADNTAIDALLNTDSGLSFADQQSMQVGIKTAKGWRQMSLSEAMKKFPDIIAAGGGVVIGGPNDGKPLSDILGTSVVLNSTKQASEMKANVTAGSAWNGPSSTPSGSSSVNVGGIQVTLSDGAKALIQLIPINANNSTGNPTDPTTAHVDANNPVRGH